MKKPNKKHNNVELLAPAGSLVKLKAAFRFGADAIYCGVPNFSLRARVNQFSLEDLREGVEYAHGLGKRVYITLNIYAHNRQIEEIKNHLIYLRKIGIDGIIASDPGIINLIKKYWPEIEIHLSTQANATNFEAVKFWQDWGVRRIILAREVSLSEIREIHEKIPEIELETFVHGAMCMSYSGRCILSKWMTGRSANLGDCAQPCRWKYEVASSKYEVLSVVDDQGRFEVDVEEDQHGTYFFNSYDMNLIEQIGDLVAAGISSLKIEGRAKSVFYLAVATRAYRKVLDAVLEKKSKKEIEKIILEQKKELENLAHRGYSTGFLLGAEPEHNFQNRNEKTPFQFVGEIEGKEKGCYVVRVHNALFSGDEVSAVTPKKNVPVRIKRILDSAGNEVAQAHGGHKNRYLLELDKNLKVGDLLRKNTV